MTGAVPHPRTSTVLVADDDAAIVDALGLMLEEEGYAVVAMTGGDIVAAAERERPGVILLDIWMSGQDGRDVCRALKAGERTAAIPVVLLSANADIAGIAAAAGADDHLAKPFDIDDLLAKVARYAGLPAG